MKKYFKYISYSILVLIPIGFIIGFSKAWNSPPSIVAAGSTSVQPLLTSLGNEYSNADLTVQPGGSSLGLKVAAEGSKSIGTASKNPYPAVQEATLEKNGYTKEMWKTNQLKTVTIAWDGIGIVYKDDLSKDTLVINNENINIIYEIFSGVKQHTLKDLFIGEGNENKNISNNEIIVPYARSGGSNASGTAASFLNESGLSINEKSNNWKQVKDILKNGSYVGNVITTNESNVESWNRFQTENKNASMIYLSLGFIQNNKKLIESNGYKIANYSKNNVLGTPNISSVSNKTYGWYSPLNVILPISLSDEITKDFIWWLVVDDKVNKYGDVNNKGLIEKMGYAPLSNEDKIKMFLNKNQINENNYKENKNAFFKSNDFDLHNENKINWYGVPKS